MDDFSVKVDTSEVERALMAMPAKLAKRAARGGLQAAGEVMLASMVALCPERTDEPTPGSNSLAPGVLKESLTTQVQVGTKSTPRVKVGPPRETAHVAWWIENGFDLISGGRKGKGGRAIRDIEGKDRHIDGKHFMSGAFDESAEKAVDVLLEQLRTALDTEDTDLEGVGADEE